MNNSLRQPGVLSEVFAEVSSSGKMSVINCQTLRDALLEDQTSEEEKQAIDRLLYAVRLGRIQMIQESSHA